MYYVLLMKDSKGERNWAVSSKQLVNYIKSIKNNCNAVAICIDARINKKDALKMASKKRTVEFNKNYPEICLEYISIEDSLMPMYDDLRIDPVAIRRLALQRKAEELYDWLDRLYWWLPSDTYNLKVNPPGFTELLSIVDNDKYKELY